MKITNGAGVLLVAGEAFAWKPWNAARITSEGRSERGMGTKRLVNDRGVFEVGPEAWGVLGLVWPKPGQLPLAVYGYLRYENDPSTFL